MTNTFDMPTVTTYSIVDTAGKIRILTGKQMPGEEANRLFFGVELEVEYSKLPYFGVQARQEYVRNEPIRYDERHMSYANTFYAVADDAQKCLGNGGVLKWEGTVECGFEVNSAPATLRYHREKLWGKFFDVAKEHLIGKANCGMHIHIAREQISEMTQAKMICFIHDIKNNAFITKIAGRSVNPRVQWRKTKYVDKRLPTGEIVQKSYGARDAIAVSAHTNGATLECRIFASVPTYQGVMQGLEFLAALIEYCDQTSSLDNDLGYLKFLRWFNTPAMMQKYPHLAVKLRRVSYLRSIPASRFKALFRLVTRKVA